VILTWHQKNLIFIEKIEKIIVIGIVLLDSKVNARGVILT